MTFYKSLWLLLNIISIHYLFGKGLIISVSKYGAYPNDNLDDTHGIQSAMDEAIRSGLRTTVEFGYGTYNLSTAITINNAINLTITGQGIDQTYLIGNSPSSIFAIKSCQGLTITSLSIDFDPVPFTAGYVHNITETYLDLQVQAPHQITVNQQIQAIFRYNPTMMRPAFGPDTYEIFQKPSPNATTSLVSPGILRIPLLSPTKFVVDDPVVVRYAFSEHAIGSMDAEDLTIQFIHIYTSWCMGFAAGRTRRLNIIDYHVIPRDQRWMSTVADCLHFVDSREYISLSNSKCSSMGDDGFNSHATYFIVKKIINSTTLILQTLNWLDILNVGIGTHLEFSTNQQPFIPHAQGTVLSIQDYDSLSKLFIFDGSIDVNENDYAIVSDSPKLIIRNFTVGNNRARGILLETRNVDIQHSTFNQTSGPAILFQPSLYWYEGPYAINVSLSHNLYIQNNEGLAHEQGVITMLPDPIQSTPVFTNIQIVSSTFLMGNYTQTLIQSYNGNNVAFQENYICTNHSDPLIHICNSRNITAHNNTVVNYLAKIEEYYILDERNPCLDNLTSLIDLPPSAFNSSFPPPVDLF